MLAIRFLKCTASRMFREEPYVTICLLDDDTSTRAQTKPGVCRTINAHWPSGGSTVRIPVPRPEMTCIVEVWDRDSTRDEDRLVGMGRINLLDYDEDGAEEEPLEMDLYFERKHVGKLNCQISYDPPSMIPIKDGERINLASLSPMANLRARLADVMTSVQSLTKTQRGALAGGFLVALLFPMFRMMVYFGVFATLGVAWSLLLGVILPVMFVMALPRLLGVVTTLALRYLTGGYPMTIQSIMFVPWVTNVKELNFRLAIADILVGNPPYQGFTPKLLSIKRVEIAGALPFRDLWNILSLSPQLSPLKDVPDFRRLATVKMDLVEIDGVTVNMEVSDKNRLNISQLLSTIDHAAVAKVLKQRTPNGTPIQFPNCLEIKVLQAKNLKAKDIDGTSDPFYEIHVRDQVRRSEPVVKSLNPVFGAGSVERFSLTEPSAVINIRLLDADVARPSDFLGQFALTSKWLLAEESRQRQGIKASVWESLTEHERAEGWIGFWIPLLNKHFREEQQCGEVQLQMRWIYDPSMPEFDPKQPCTLSPLEQLNMSRKEIRMRLGDLQWWMAMLKHVPVLLDFHGDFILQNTKIAIQDLLVGKTAKTMDENRIIEEHQAEIDQQLKQIEQQQQLARKQIQVDVYKPSQVISSSPAVAHQTVQVSSAAPAYSSTKVVPIGGPSQRWPGDVPILLKEPGTLPNRTEDRLSQRELEVEPPVQRTATETSPSSTTSTTGMEQQQPTTMKERRRDKIRRHLHLPHIHMPHIFHRSTGGRSESSSDPYNDNNLDAALYTPPTSTSPRAPPQSRATVRQPTETPSGEENKLKRFHVEKTEDGAESTDDRQILVTSQGAELVDENKLLVTSRGLETLPPENILEKKEHIHPKELVEEDASGLPLATARPGGHKPLVAADKLYAPASEATDTTRSLEREYQKEKTMEKLVAGGNNDDYVAIESSSEESDGEIRENVHDEDDLDENLEGESKNRRPRDKDHDEDTEFDEYGRRYAKLKPIAWQKQFQARHGDPGITIFKLIERLVRGLVPHIVTDARFNSTLMGSTAKSLVKHPSRSGHGARHVASAIGAKIKGTAHKVKEQGKLVQNKLLHRHEGRGEEGAVPDASAAAGERAGVPNTTPPGDESSVSGLVVAPSAAAVQAAAVSGEDIRWQYDRGLQRAEQQQPEEKIAQALQPSPTVYALETEGTTTTASDLNALTEHPQLSKEDESLELHHTKDEDKSFFSTTESSSQPVSSSVLDQQTESTVAGGEFEPPMFRQESEPIVAPASSSQVQATPTTSTLLDTTTTKKTTAERDVDVEEKEEHPPAIPMMYGGEEYSNQPKQFQQFQLAQPELMMGPSKYTSASSDNRTTTDEASLTESKSGETGL